MPRRILNLMRGLSTHWLGKLGVALVTSSFVVFLCLEFLRAAGVLTNTYMGLITYMTLPLLFVLGLVLIPLAWLRLRRKTGMSFRQLAESRFPDEDLQARFLGSGLVGSILLLTLVNLLFLGGGSARMLKFMDSARFCGTACHEVMGPEWATYQVSPHAHVACVECHVGEGARAHFDAKLNGLWQIISATFDLYERPIPTPVHQLRPARDTCEKCHWPDKFYGDRIKSFTHYRSDEANSPRYTTLNLRVGSGRGGSGQIHWHVAEANEVRYASVDDMREEILWVEVRRPDGSWHRYENSAYEDDGQGGTGASVQRVMDCVDCHNRATHIYEDPDLGLDQRMAEGRLDAGLPYLKREALKAIRADYPDSSAARKGVDEAIRGFYRESYPELALSKAPEIDQAVETLQAMVARNIHPQMEVGWGAYPSHLGHRDDGGCFRCHQPEMEDEEGEFIDFDCELCHFILSEESREPYEFLPQ